MPFGFIQSVLHTFTRISTSQLHVEIKPWNVETLASCCTQSSKVSASAFMKRLLFSQRQGESEVSVRIHPLNMPFEWFTGFFLSQLFVSFRRTVIAFEKKTPKYSKQFLKACFLYLLPTLLLIQPFFILIHVSCGASSLNAARSIFNIFPFFSNLPDSELSW